MTDDELTLVQEGWFNWLRCPPAERDRVECRRQFGDIDTFFITRGDLPPSFNVYGLFWRPAIEGDENDR